MEPLEGRMVLAADLSVTITDSPDPVRNGSLLTYTITVANSGPDAAENVTLSDAIPDDTFFASLSVSQGTANWDKYDDLVTANFGTILPGATAELTLRVSVDDETPDGAMISNTATASTTTAESNLANNSDTETTVVQAVDLAVTLVDAPDAVVAGTNLTYTLTLQNVGSLNATKLGLSGEVPTGTTFVSATQSSGPDFNLGTPPVGGTGAISAGAFNLAPGATATFSIVVNVNADVPDGANLTFTVHANSYDIDPNEDNNSDTETTSVVAQAEVSVTKSDGPDPVVAGNDLEYVVTVSNAGPSDAQNVTLVDVLPPNTTLDSVTTTPGNPFTVELFPPVGTVVATAPTLAAGATATFLILVTTDSSLADGSTLTNTVTVSTTTADANPANNTDTETTTVQAVDLEVIKEGDVELLTPGDDLTYTITVRNNGSVDGEDVFLEDPLPAGTTFVSIQQTSGSAQAIITPLPSVNGPVIVDIGTLPGNSEATFELVVNVDANATDFVANAASVTSSSPEPSLADNSDTEITFLATPGSAGLVDDPDHPGQHLLLVAGTERNDVLIIEPRPSNRLQVRVKNTGELLGIFSNSLFQRIVAFGLDGDDVILVNSRIRKPAELHGNDGDDHLSGGTGADFLFGEEGDDALFGGNQNDTLRGGSGDDLLRGGTGRDRLHGEDGHDDLHGDADNDLLLGGAGDDQMFGGSGRDLLIGGTGGDHLFGQGDDDVLIGGSTSHDDDEAALFAILAEWSARGGIVARIGDLSGLLNETTVQDDGEVDELNGGSGRDWYLDFELADLHLGFNPSLTRGDRRN